jgi:hypothetical protein
MRSEIVCTAFGDVTRAAPFHVVLFAAAAAAWIAFVRMPLAQQVACVPDDGFYYLNLASNYARLGAWTFDGGLSHTTGFHLLHAYASAAIAPFFAIESTSRLLAVQSLVAYALTATAAIVWSSLAARFFGAGARVGVAIVFGAGAALACPRMMMEWPYVVLLDGLFFHALATRRAKWLAMAAFLAPIARTDAVIPVMVALGVYALARAPRERGRFPSALPSALAPELAAGFACTAGFAVVSFFCFVHSGHFTQGNARMKAHWGEQHVALGKIAGVVTRTVAPGFWAIESPNELGSALFVVVLVAAAAIAFAVRARRDETGPPPAANGARTLLAAALLAAAATFTIYAWKVAGLMPWYCAHFMGPVALVAGAAAGRIWRGAALPIGLGLVAIESAIGVVIANEPIWPHQSLVLEAGTWLRAHPEYAPAAAWNAGISGYFSDSKVVNIDGLVNDDAQPYLFADRLTCYLRAAGVRTILDQECSGLPDDAVARWDACPDAALRPAARSLHAFGRVAAEPKCAVHAWQLDRAGLGATCAP